VRERIEAMEEAAETGGAMAELTAATPSRAPRRAKPRQQPLCERGTDSQCRAGMGLPAASTTAHRGPLRHQRSVSKPAMSSKASPAPDF
jgi:hypothetical protein